MKKLRNFTKAFLLAVGLGLALIACSEIDKAGIFSTLDARDAAVSRQDIAAYSRQIWSSYNSNGRNKVEVVAQMINLFSRFQTTEMHSFDRNVRLLGDGRAECIQSYRLKVRADNQWREITEREYLQLVKTNDGWKISAGL